MKNWNTITTQELVEAIVKKSFEKTQLIFKHSVSCGISSYAQHRLEAGYGLLAGKADLNYLDLLAYRQVSNFIADLLNVQHQSPQIIVLKNGEAVYSVTHHSIEAEDISANL